MVPLVGGFRAAAGGGRRLTTGNWRALATLSVAVAALTGCNSALGATASGSIASDSVFSIPAASGTLSGSGDRHLTLHLTGARGYLIRFADRPLPQALVIRNVDFARRFKHDFAGMRPKAVLTYTRPDGGRPVSVGLTIGKPRWNARHRGWAFAATRTRKPSDSSAGATGHTEPSLLHPLRKFIGATLQIDGPATCDRGVVRPNEDCEDADLAFVDLTGDDLTGVNFSGANLTGADLTGANFTGAKLGDSSLTDSDLTGTDLSGEDLSGEVFIGSDLHNVDLSGADLTGVDFPGVNLSGANLSSANLTDADFTDADLIDADVTDADVSGAYFSGARFCGAILPQGGIGGGC